MLDKTWITGCSPNNTRPPEGGYPFIQVLSLFIHTRYSTTMLFLYRGLIIKHEIIRRYLYTFVLKDGSTINPESFKRLSTTVWCIIHTLPAAWKYCQKQPVRQQFFSRRTFAGCIWVFRRHFCEFTWLWALSDKMDIPNHDMVAFIVYELISHGFEWVDHSVPFCF